MRSIQNHARYRFQAFARCHLKWTGPRLRFAALHRIEFRAYCFVPMSYFYSETNEWSQDWAKRWARLWSATTSRQFHRKFHFKKKKKWLVAGLYLQSINTFLTVKLSQYRKSGSTFSSSEPVAARSDCCRLGKLCRPSDPPKLRLSAAWLTPGPVTGHLSGRVPDRVCSFIPGLAWAPYATDSVVA